MADRGDPLIAKLCGMQKAVHRCQHKMRSFVRFREVGPHDAARREFAAWFEPTHHTVEPTAPFFRNRFGDMDWHILTPDISVTCTDGALQFGPGVARPDLPQDANEQLWRTYFRNIFNPARLKPAAMRSEMSVKYWKNMPEAQEIPDLIATAPARARAMAEAQASQPNPRLAAWRARPQETGEEGLAGCTRCALAHAATQAVPGQGPSDALLMIVGEQPGEEEDLSGTPFVGPAGRVLDSALAEIGVERERLYLTNAVKHYKFVVRGKRRIHQRPNAGEVQACQCWLKHELARVKPKVILGLGATATFALTGLKAPLGEMRGQVIETDADHAVIPTYHPAYILRAPDAEERARARAALGDDLREAVRLAGLR